ncbi:hypothetical protein RUM44_011896 [Polyplax serrata]|uniref:Uncharacterized protein n=1 Tax=Polyplax serrata TaxID=468196 RepID=A0ABR1BBY6_POLSC
MSSGPGGRKAAAKKKEEGTEGKEDEAANGNGDKKDHKPDRPTNGDAKPGSAGVNIREGTHRLLALAMKGEWPPVDQVLKSIEKAVASGGEDVNTAPLMGVMDPITGMTPLMYAVKDNRTTFIDRMIEMGVDVAARNFDNYNALHIASMHSREDVVKLLLTKKGVDVYSSGGLKEQTAVHMVATRQTGTATSILRILLNAAGKEIRLRTDGVIIFLYLRLESLMSP